MVRHSIGYITSIDVENRFSPWNLDALQHIGVSQGALSNENLTFHVRGELYEELGIARENHECAGSMNVSAIDTRTGNRIEFSHIFYRDVTGHHGSPYHWNHELKYRVNDGEFTLFSKRNTVDHQIPQSSEIELYYTTDEDITEAVIINWDI